MRVLVCSHSAVVPAYREKWRLLAQRRGWELHLVIPQRWPEGGAMLEAEPEKAGKLKVHVLGIRLAGRIGFFSYAGLGALAASLKPDLVYAEEEPYAFAAWQAARAAAKLGVPFAFFSWENIRRRYKPPLNWLRVRNQAAAAGGVFGNSESVALFRAWGFAGKSALIPQYGVDTQRFKPQPAKRRSPVFGFVGRLVPEKGVPLLIEACAKTGLKGLVIGQGPEEARLKALAAELKAPVEFRAFVPFAQRLKIFQDLDVLVLPSLGTRQWKEQFGRVLIEAMASGRPCLGSSSGAIPEVIGKAGLVFEEGSAASLAKAMQRLAASPALRQKLGKAARQRAVSEYDERFLAGQLAAFLEHLVAN